MIGEQEWARPMCLRIVASVPHGGETIGEKRKVIIDGEEFEVDVEVDGEQYRATIEGRTFEFILPEAKGAAHENEVQAVVESEVVPSALACRAKW